MKKKTLLALLILYTNTLFATAIMTYPNALDRNRLLELQNETMSYKASETVDFFQI